VENSNALLKAAAHVNRQEKFRMIRLQKKSADSQASIIPWLREPVIEK
jgi:hypothetical protein